MLYYITVAGSILAVETRGGQFDNSWRQCRALTAQFLARRLAGAPVNGGGETCACVGHRGERISLVRLQPGRGISVDDAGDLRSRGVFLRWKIWDLLLAALAGESSVAAII
jgi:hypothetical protein